METTKIEPRSSEASSPQGHAQRLRHALDGLWRRAANMGHWRLTLLALVMIPLSAMVQGCALIEILGEAFASICDLTEYTVTKTEDTDDGLCLPDDCSLREAVNQANNCDGPQTIHLPAGFYALTMGSLSITDELTLLGEGAIIDGGANPHRLITVEFDSSRPPVRPEVVIRGVILQNGTATASYGGGALLVLGHAVRVRLVESVVQGNRAGSVGTSGAMGGGITVARGGHLVLENSRVLNNTAFGDGGGIALESSTFLFLITSEVAGNHAADGYSGGGIFMGYQSEAQINGSTIRDNVSDWSGGGIHSGGNRLIVYDSLIRGNRAAGPGGGISSANYAHILGSTIEGNSASAGGGIYHYDRGSDLAPSRLDVETTIIVDNQALIGGGGIFNDEGSVLRLDRSAIRGNSARAGAGIDNLAVAYVQYTTIEGNQGGGFRNRGFGRATLSETTLSHNTASDAATLGAAVSNEDRGSIALMNVTISGNDAGGDAPVVFAEAEGRMIMDYVTVMGNHGIGLFSAARYRALTFGESIFVGNSGGNCAGSPTTYGQNLSDTEEDCFVPAYGDILLLGRDPRIGPLADNGGPTMTHALLTGSPALDAAARRICPGIDQRAVVRPFGAACDIGAYEAEFSFASAAIVAATPEASTSTPTPPLTATPLPSQLPPTPTSTPTATQQAAAPTSPPLPTSTPQPPPPTPTTVPPPKPTDTPKPSLPAAPSGLTVTNRNCSGQGYSFTLAWKDNSNNEDGFRVYLDGKLMATLKPNTTSYVVQPPDFGSHSYAVVAYNAAGESKPASIQDGGCVY